MQLINLHNDNLLPEANLLFYDRRLDSCIDVVIKT
jgi:hypothetical protein